MVIDYFLRLLILILLVNVSRIFEHYAGKNVTITAMRISFIID